MATAGQQKMYVHVAAHFRPKMYVMNMRTVTANVCVSSCPILREVGCASSLPASTVAEHKLDELERNSV